MAGVTFNRYATCAASVAAFNPKTMPLEHVLDKKAADVHINCQPKALF